MREFSVRDLVVTTIGAACLLVTALYWRLEAASLAGASDDTPHRVALSYYLFYGCLGAGLAVLAVAGVALRKRAPRVGRTALDLGVAAALLIGLVQLIVAIA